MRLLQSTWAELLTLTMAFRSLEQLGSHGGDIDSVGGENIGSGGLKLRYATDYWLDEKMARECDLLTVGTSSSSNGNTSTTTTSTTSSTAVTFPTVLDIFNLVGITYSLEFSFTTLILYIGIFIH